MYNKNKLIGVIYERGLTGAKIAKEIGTSQRTFYRKLESGKWSRKDIDSISTVVQLDADAIKNIFFA